MSFTENLVIPVAICDTNSYRLIKFFHGGDNCCLHSNIPRGYMKPKHLLQKLEQDFPFKGYTGTNPAPYETVATVVSRYLETGSRVFDFGSGPCDKTAMAAYLGMQCDACDDLSVQLESN